MENKFLEKENFCHKEFSNFRIEFINRKKPYTMQRRHFHDYWEIYYLVYGDRYYFIENESFHIQRGDLVLIPPNRIHKTYEGDYSDHGRVLMEFEEDFLNENSRLFREKNICEQLYLQSGPIVFKGEDRKSAEQLFSKMIAELFEEHEEEEAGFQIMLLSLFLLIIRQKHNETEKTAKKVGGEQEKIWEITQYLTQNYQEKITLENLSKQFYLSKFYLCRLFKRTTGFTVVEYVHTVRMKEACRMLSNTSWKISKISEMLGYESVTQFERIFYTYFQKSPTAYRKLREKNKETKMGKI